MQTFDDQRTQALGKLAALQEAERQRQLSLQNTPAAQIAQVERHLVEIDRAEARDQAEQMKRTIAGFVTWADEQAKVLAAQLDHYSHADLPTYRDMVRAFDAKRAETKLLYESAYDGVAMLEVQRSQVTPLPPEFEGRSEAFKQQQIVARGRQWAGQLCAVEIAPLSARDTLILWIAPAQGDERIYRRGIVFTLIGELYDPSPGWQPDRSLARMLGQGNLNWS